MSAIFLIGARACGKTTVGRLLATSLDVPFIDLDQSLTDAIGKSVADIVAEGGWELFRRIESEVLAKTMANAHTAVIATGGGVILAEENRRLLAANGLTFWLNTPVRIVAQRLRAEPLAQQRPGLSCADPLTEIEAVMEERAPIYAACADHIIDGALPAHEICRNIADIYRGVRHA